MSMPDREAVEVFLQEASEHLQYLREYVSVLQEIEPRREDLERLYIAAHTLSGTSASYGFPRFSEVAGKLAHVFQYALNAPLGNDLHGPLTEFLSDGISVLETDLLEISDVVRQVPRPPGRGRGRVPIQKVIGGELNGRPGPAHENTEHDDKDADISPN